MSEFTRCCAAVITTKDKKILLQKRDDKPNIAFPGYWALIGGPPYDEENPLISICREIDEELVHISGESLRFGDVNYIGSGEHQDKDRTEYLFHVELLTPTSSVKIVEGQGFGLFSLEECVSLPMFAPHHQMFLIYYKQRVQDLLSLDANNPRLGEKMSKKKTIHDYVRITTFSKIKDYDAFEKGTNYVQVDGDNISALLHTEEKAAFVGHIEFLPGVPRGNHYHKRKVEYMVFLTGETMARYWLADDPSEAFETVLRSGDFVRILPGVAHTYTAIGEKVTSMEYSPQKYESADVFSADD